MPVASFPSPSPSSAASSASSSSGPTRSLHLAAAIDRHGAIGGLGRRNGLARSEGSEGSEGTEAGYLALARLAERGALDFVALDDPPATADGSCEPPAVLARIAQATDRIGLIVGVTAPAADQPPDAAGISSAVAALNRISQGRAGWTVGAAGGAASDPAREVTSEAAGRGAGRRAGVAAGAATGDPAAGPAADAGRSRVGGPAGGEARRRAVERFAEAVTRAWDVPPPPLLGRPVTALDATEPAARGAAARYADIAFVRVAEPERAGRVGAELRLLAAEAGRDPDRLLVFAELSVDLGGGELGPEPGVEVALAPDGAGGVLFSGGPVDLADLIGGWRRAGAVDGFLIRPVEPTRDLERFVNGTVALLQHRGLFRTFHPGATLREHLGLHRPPRPLAAGGARRAWKA